MVTYRLKKKKKNPWPLVAGIAGIMALAALVLFQPKSKPKETIVDETAEQPVDDSAITIEPSLMGEAAPQVFTELKKQQQFESLYKSFKSVFTPPTPGSPVRVYKARGGRIEGDLVRFTPTGLVLTTPDGIINIAKDEMDEVTKQLLFVEDFSRAQAENKVQKGIVGQPPESLSDLLLKPESTSVTEVRRFSSERLNARYGPGRNYAVVPGAELFRGQSVYIVQETNGWICVKDRETASNVVGWIPKFASFTMHPEDKAVISREVNKLLDAGFVVNVNPMKNEALVDIYEWRITDSAAIEGYCRLLAYYCGHQRNSKLYWVDIRDALSNKRMAEYSESKGFKVF